ncbi:surface antigen family protein [Ehrlichia chaffeensis str. Heartland]|uniref:P44/Msp2 family outer membrane protein n=1 Tax=Ehrlichia chaffeensis TaxID=945 RepID=UPI000444AD85|nr:P44/Msp2 family outer membrane protein [Ehrlichia chaffeensis]AHX03226.1 surface antigen family protein [Ehrlichia chaffeensis str. Heartland]AHX09020.1 surface antigen family protein [Ehrlichia chaffeensis str. Saint Vincent]AHX10569.1 surface antigen family protein [Ehrlichia chaffeensis str. West Paces]
MNKKNKFFTISTAIVCLSLLPGISFSETINSSIKKQPGLYISGQYKPSVSVFSNFSVRETNVPTKQLIALKKEIDSVAIDTTGNANAGISKPENFTIPYTAEFQDNVANFNGAIGYSFPDSLRIEIEGFHEKFDVKNPGGYTQVKDAYRYFALARDLKNGAFQPKENNTGIYHTVMKNDGLSILSTMVNICYDFSVDELPVLPYMCAGMGINAIEFFDALHVKFAYQGKLGISYQLFTKVNLFLDGYYHQVIGNQFKNLNVNHVYILKESPKVTSAVATLDIAYFGGEVGIRFTF